MLTLQSGLTDCRGKTYFYLLLYYFRLLFQDGRIRKVDVWYKNANEDTFRVTNRGVRELVIISPIDEVDIYERLDHMM